VWGFIEPEAPAPPLTPGRRLRKWLIRLACVAYVIVLGAGIIDYNFGRGRKGFGPWVFAASGWFGGMLGVWAGQRINQWAARRGDIPSRMGEKRHGGKDLVVGLLAGLVFSGIGLSMVTSFMTDLPPDAPQVVKDRFNAQSIMQWAVAPFFLAAGGACLMLVVAALAKWGRRL
jgi:hypothetical protein